MKTLHFLYVILGIASVYFIFKPFIPTHIVPLFQKETSSLSSGDLKLTSSAFDNYEVIPFEYTCDGGRRLPFTISGTPKAAKSLAIIMDDPDAPDETFTHWVIWNIHPTVTSIEEGKNPEGGQVGTNSSGREGYIQPCPASGKHRYFITLYALDKEIGLDGKAKKADILSAMRGHILGQSLLIGVYGR